jgi:hypothetical protein
MKLLLFKWKYYSFDPTCSLPGMSHSLGSFGGASRSLSSGASYALTQSRNAVGGIGRIGRPMTRDEEAVERLLQSWLRFFDKTWQQITSVWTGILFYLNFGFLKIKNSRIGRWVFWGGSKFCEFFGLDQLWWWIRDEVWGQSIKPELVASYNEISSKHDDFHAEILDPFLAKMSITIKSFAVETRKYSVNWWKETKIWIRKTLDRKKNEFRRAREEFADWRLMQWYIFLDFLDDLKDFLVDFVFYILLCGWICKRRRGYDDWSDCESEDEIDEYGSLNQ